MPEVPGRVVAGSGSGLSSRAAGGLELAMVVSGCEVDQKEGISFSRDTESQEQVLILGYVK